MGHFEPEAFKKDSLADQNIRKTPADFPLLFTIVDKFFIPLWFSACACNSLGSLSMFCRSRDGQCQCRRKFQGQKCNECRIGFYDFPRCKACGCNPAGIKLLPGQTNGCGSVNNVRIRWLYAEFFLSLFYIWVHRSNRHHTFLFPLHKCQASSFYKSVDRKYCVATFKIAKNCTSAWCAVLTDFSRNKYK